MTIVCATHFSDSSFNAVRVAAELARKHRQPLWLVNVLPMGIASPHGDKFEVASNNALQLEAQALATEGIDARTAILRGALDRAVGRFCTDKNAQLLVVGDTSHRLSPVMAGTLDKLAYGIEIPLLVVRDPRPFEAWARHEAPLKVMLALDHTWASAVARDWIKRLADYGALDLVAAHVWWPRDEYQRRGLPVPDPENHDAIAQMMRRETESALSGLPANVKHRVHLEMDLGHVAERLLELAAAELVDVFVLGTHPHHGPLSRIWSVSHNVLADAPMSVACVPERTALPSPGHFSDGEAAAHG